MSVLIVGGSTPAIAFTVNVSAVASAFQTPVTVSAVSMSVVAIVKFARNSTLVIVPDANVLFTCAGNVMIIVSPTEYTASPSSGSLAIAEEIPDAACAFGTSRGTTPILKIIPTIIARCVFLKSNTLHLSFMYNSNRVFTLRNLTFECIQMHVKKIMKFRQHY